MLTEINKKIHGGNCGLRTKWFLMRPWLSCLFFLLLTWSALTICDLMFRKGIKVPTEQALAPWEMRLLIGQNIENYYNQNKSPPPFTRRKQRVKYIIKKESISYKDTKKKASHCFFCWYRFECSLYKYIHTLTKNECEKCKLPLEWWECEM